jgi:6,7-dimethyl-8-ribityllumazine synthase
MPEKKPSLALVAATFHKEMAEEMIAAASHEATAQNATIYKTLRVAGSYEIPLITQKLMKDENIDAILVLGYIEKGETLHGEVMGYVIHQALMDLQLQFGKPIGIGIIGPGATRQQAEVRKIGAAKSAVRAALQSLQILFLQ